MQTIKVNVEQYQDLIFDRLAHFKASGPLAATGFGTDPSPERALIKAISECAERHVLKSLPKGAAPTSNGFAAHANVELAKRRAIMEIMERDAFLVTWLSGSNPRWLNRQELHLSPFWTGFHQALESHGFSTQFGIVGSADGLAVATAAIKPGDQSGLKFGVAFACACQPTLTEAIESCLNELARAATVILNRKNRGRIFEVISETDVIDGASTFEFYLNPSNLRYVDDFLCNSGEPLKLDSFRTSFEIFERRIESPKLEIVVARAYTNDAQDLFFGKPTNQNINIDRLRHLDLLPKNSVVMPLP